MCAGKIFFQEKRIRKLKTSMWDAIDVWTILVLHDPDQKIAFEVSKSLRKPTRTRETTLHVGAKSDPNPGK